MWRKVWLCLLGGIVTAGVGPSAVQAGDATSASGWTMTGGLYGWFPWVEGTVTARDEAFNIYATPIDLIEHFDAPPAMANFEARRGKVSLWGDVLYAKFAFGDDFASEAEPIPILKLSGKGSSSTDYSLGVYQFGAFYQVADFAGDNGHTSLEVGAGARFIDQNFRVKARIDTSAQIRLGKLADRIEKRIQKIQNQEERLESLAALNALRKDLLNKEIGRAADKGRQRRVTKLQNTLKRVDRRGEAIAALEAVEQLRLELLRAALNVDGDEFNRQFAFVGTGDMDWVDPTISLRVQHHFGNGQSITAVGDFGGFNVEDGLSSQMVLTYDIEGTLFGFDTTTSLGYKALWLRYEDQTSRGKVGMDAWLHGPIAEVAFRW